MAQKRLGSAAMVRRKQVQIRLSDDALAELDDLHAQVSKSQRYRGFDLGTNRSAFIRYILALGMQALRAELKGDKPRRK